MTGSRGPVGKPSAQRRRRNKDEMPADKVKVLGAVPVPPGDRKWHALALRWYESLADSGQSRFYEPSDWATAAIIAESMSRELKPQTVIGEDGKQHRVTRPLRGASVSAWLKAMTVLLATEGDRRRMRLELARAQAAGEEGGASVSELDQYRDRIPGVDPG
jgi:hypothetical protein